MSTNNQAIKFNFKMKINRLHTESLITIEMCEQTNLFTYCKQEGNKQ